LSNALVMLLLALVFVMVWASCSTTRQTTRACCAADEAKETTSGTNAASTPAATNDLFRTPFLAPEFRRPLSLDHRVTTHDGRVTTLRELADRPLALSFAYSRCPNPNKCPRIVHAMGQLRGELERARLLGRVRLALISYDPAFDTPAILRGFARLNGYQPGPDALFLRPENDAMHRLFHDLEVRASFNDDGVALHGIQLLLLDKRGRLARSYHTLLWDHDQALHDLQRLAEE
jgi:cytochrome oxidase Cu insertion factor (SCO1/SenC/PrrC family)